MTLDEVKSLYTRNSIRLKIGGPALGIPCTTRFGGVPEVPGGFSWPRYVEEGTDGSIRSRPLAFLAQFRLEDLAVLDTDGMLPRRGLLSFFYDLDTMRWGFDPEDRGCCRVCWFRDTSGLRPAVFPEELAEEYRLPPLNITAFPQPDLPDPAEFPRTAPDLDTSLESARAALRGGEEAAVHKLLGWPDIIQDAMTREADLVSQGYYLGSAAGARKIPAEVRRKAEEESVDTWLLLFQLDTVEEDSFELMFGDCGRLYFYIRREDLKAGRFDRVWLILQCS